MNSLVFFVLCCFFYFCCSYCSGQSWSSFAFVPSCATNSHHHAPYSTSRLHRGHQQTNPFSFSSTKLHYSSKEELDDALDEIDDFFMDRPENKRDQVKVYGVWLDQDVAGRKAGQANRSVYLKKRAAKGVALSDREKAEVFYEDAISYMSKGMYSESKQYLARAVQYAGPETRRGGEFQLWQSQALQAAGQVEDALEVLKGMKHHRDRAVRKVANELRIVMEAPETELIAGVDYIDFGPMETDWDDYSRKRRSRSGRVKSKVEFQYIPTSATPEIIAPLVVRPEEKDQDLTLTYAAVFAIVFGPIFLGIWLVLSPNLA